MISLLVCVLLAVLSIVPAKDVLELHGSSFELELVSHKYIAVLFYNDSDLSKAYHSNWVRAASEIDELPADCEIAKAYGGEPEMMELMRNYQIELPSIGVFRKGMMSEYRGPLDVKGMANFLKQDALPSVQHITTLEEMRSVISENNNALLFGIFKDEDIQEMDPEEGYSISAWGQFQASADALRWHVPFYAVHSADILHHLDISEKDLPVVFMATTEHDGLFLRFKGEIFEINLSEWVLANTAPAMGELTVSSSAGELYTTQFFTSHRLKFILYVPPELLNEEVVKEWGEVASLFSKQAIFAYVTQPVELLGQLGLDTNSRYPQIVAQKPVPLSHTTPQSMQPTHSVASQDILIEANYKSGPLDSLDSVTLTKFVAGVITGTVPKSIKSEPVPKSEASKQLVVTAVGSNVLSIVSAPGKDVLLLLYQPWCELCRSLLPSFEVLGRVVQSEDRIVLAKINTVLNDIPENWAVKSYPTLLWFRASDKAALSGAPGMVAPRSYWDAGYSLIELLGFLHRHSSFDSSTLRTASTEQLYTTLLEEEVVARKKYDEDEMKYLRNKGRTVYANPLVDYLAGEVVFDGCRLHVVLLVASWVLCISMAGYLYARSSGGAKVIKKKIV